MNHFCPFLRSKGKPYWQNKRTGKKTWENPFNSSEQDDDDDDNDDGRGGVGGSGGGSEDEDEWEEIFNKRKGKPYWRNKRTEEKTWVKPF